MNFFRVALGIDLIGTVKSETAQGQISGNRPIKNSGPDARIQSDDPQSDPTAHAVTPNAYPGSIRLAKKTRLTGLLAYNRN